MKTSIKLIHWAPRILGILSILFISIFAADSFEHGTTIWQKLVSLAMHLIPTFILTIILIIAWKWERIGGILFMLLGIGLSPIIFILNYNRNHFSTGQSLGIVLMINFPFILVGILFMISDKIKKKEAENS
jgi:hypothetical protein